MSMCKTCLKDSSKHSKKLWTLHNWCPLCQKHSKEHSDELWSMHQRAVVKGAKGDKIRPVTIGFARASVGRVVEWNVPVSPKGQPSPYKIEVIPIHMHCAQCSLAMGDIEVDNGDVLGGLCLKCFAELTDQTDSLNDKFPNYMSYEYCQKIRKRMEERK